MSGPVPSPSTKGTIGLSGTLRLPFSNAILSPLVGTFASLYVAIKCPVGGAALGAPNVVDAVRSDHTRIATQASNSGYVRLVLRLELVDGRGLARRGRVRGCRNGTERTNHRLSSRAPAQQRWNLMPDVCDAVLEDRV